MSEREQRLRAAHLYLVCDASLEGSLEQALEGGVDIVQLRMKDATQEEIVAVGSRFAALCHRYGALFIINDRPELVAAAGADGAHVGQDDLPVREARELIGPDRLLGLSTHSPAQVLAADPGQLDYIGIGPIHSTPTKPGRPATGTALVSFAAGHTELPFFAIGGINAGNVHMVVRAGARRVAVVRALTQARDPAAMARRLRRAVVQEQAVGAT